MSLPSAIEPKSVPKSAFFASLTAPYIPVLTPETTHFEGSVEPLVFALSANSQDLTNKPIYKPPSKWKWITGHSVQDVHVHHLSSGATCKAFIKTARVSNCNFQYVSKSWPQNAEWHGFFSELALYKTQLKCLQGYVVPSIIDVFVNVGGVDVAFEPPHHSFWIEASIDMPLVLKQRCVDAFRKLHAQKVLHGDVELRHMLIGGDGKVTLIDFQASRSITPIPDVQLGQAWPEELSREMRKVLVKLDYPGARMAEQRRRIAEAPLDDQDPVPLDEWNQDWIFPDFAPRRFVMPGQTPKQLHTAVQAFLALIDKLQQSELCDPPSSLPPPPSPFPPIPNTVSVHRKKRKVDDDFQVDPPTQDKRQRCQEPDSGPSDDSESEKEPASSGSQTTAPSSHEAQPDPRIRIPKEFLWDAYIHPDRTPPITGTKRKAETAFPQSYSKKWKISRTDKCLGSLCLISREPQEDKSNIQASKSFSVGHTDGSTPPVLSRSTLSFTALPCTVMGWTRNMLSRFI